MAATLFDPVNVYKALAPDIGIVDGPFEYFCVAGIRMPMPFTTRMTVIRLSDGNLFLHSPIAYEEKLASRLTQLGRIRHLVSPNQWHYAHIGEWQRAFPDAIVWGSRSAQLRAKARHIDVRFTHFLQPDPPPDWCDDIDQVPIPGGIFKELVFFHAASRTLILTDTMMNLDPAKTEQPWRGLAKLFGMAAPHGGLFFGMRLPLLLQRKKARSAFAKIRSWNAQRIVLAHGAIFERDGDEVVRRLFGD